MAVAMRLPEVNNMSSHSIRLVVFFALLGVGAAVLPVSLIAQQSPAVVGNVTAQVTAPAATTAGPATTAATPAALGPRIDSGLFSGATQPSPLFDSAPAPSPAPAPEGVHAGTDVAMMGVGAAAIVVGVIVGGDGGAIIAITGGVIGLVGWYRFLR